MKKIIVLLILSTLLMPVSTALALINYSAGSIEIGGVQFLQDATDPHRYYYLPPVPRVAMQYYRKNQQ